MPGVSKNGKLLLKIPMLDPGIELAADPEARRAMKEMFQSIPVQ